MEDFKLSLEKILIPSHPYYFTLFFVNVLMVENGLRPCFLLEDWADSKQIGKQKFQKVVELIKESFTTIERILKSPGYDDYRSWFIFPSDVDLIKANKEVDSTFDLSVSVDVRTNRLGKLLGYLTPQDGVMHPVYYRLLLFVDIPGTLPSPSHVLYEYVSKKPVISKLKRKASILLCLMQQYFDKVDVWYELETHVRDKQYPKKSDMVSKTIIPAV